MIQISHYVSNVVTGPERKCHGCGIEISKIRREDNEVWFYWEAKNIGRAFLDDKFSCSHFDYKACKDVIDS